MAQRESSDRVELPVQVRDVPSQQLAVEAPCTATSCFDSAGKAGPDSVIRKASVASASAVGTILIAKQQTATKTGTNLIARFTMHSPFKIGRTIMNIYILKGVFGHGISCCIISARATGAS
jgi:hypothetical protein